MNSPPIVRDEEQRGGENGGRQQEREQGPIHAPPELGGVFILDPLINRINFLPDSALEEVGSKHGHKREREQQGSGERKSHGIGHGMEKLSGWAGERVDGDVTGNDDRDGIKNGAVHIARRGQDDFVKVNKTRPCAHQVRDKCSRP